MVRHTLFSNQGAAGNGATQIVAFGGDYLVMATGTFGGTTVTLQQQNVDGVWVTIPDLSLTAAGSAILTLAKGTPIRAVATGGTPSALYVTATKV